MHTRGQRVLSAVLSFPGMGLGALLLGLQMVLPWQLAFISVQTRRRKITIQCPLPVAVVAVGTIFPSDALGEEPGQRGTEKLIM